MVLRRLAILLTLGLLMGATPLATVRAQSPTCNGMPATGTEATEGNDVLIGTNDHDFIDGLGGDDVICALGGTDSVRGGAGNDYLDGGGGADTVSYVGPYGGFGSEERASIAVDLRAGSSTGAHGSDQLVVGSFENIDAGCSSISDDTLIGDDRNNVIVGGAGNDHLVGNGGNDRLHGVHGSWQRTDAICWRQPDDDILEGGDGDDHLFGEEGSNELDGGPGTDVLDGGAGPNTCTNGERYARCQIQEPPPPPPVCGDGVDNDADSKTDHPNDPDCASPHDLTESTGADPECSDGLDNDGDGQVDYPEDYGCFSLHSGVEHHCALPCPPIHLTINWKLDGQRRFTGGIIDYLDGACVPDRTIVLRRQRPGRDLIVRRTTTDQDGSWQIDRSPRRRGRFYAVALPRKFVNAEGDYVSCARLRSETISAG